MSEAVEEERQLRLELMRADIAQQTWWEPWKAMAAAFGAGIAFATAFLGLATWILSRLLATGHP